MGKVSGVGTTRAVLFDLDETLIARHDAIRDFIGRQYTRFADRLAPLSAYEYTTAFLWLEENGHVDKQRLYPRLVADLAITGVTADALYADYRAGYPGLARLTPGARETVEALRRDGLATGIVSNGHTDVQTAKLAATGLDALMDIVVVSEAAGLRKPDPAIFELACRRLGIDLRDGLFVGDNPTADIAGAGRAGLRTAWVRNGADWPVGVAPHPDAEIDRLEEVLRLAL